MRARIIIALLLAATLTTFSATQSRGVIAQSTVPILTGTTQPIKVGPGNQTNPRVACSIASYTEQDDLEGTSFIKYVDFVANAEHTIGNGLDRLSDTDGQRIAFTQFDADGDHVVLYDIVSQTTRQIPGVGNSAPAIGGNLIAFVHGDHTTTSTFEI